MNRLTSYVFAIFFICPAYFVMADVVMGQSLPPTFRVEAVQLLGLHKTSAAVVQNELGIAVGDQVSAADVDAGAQRLRNMQIFSQVEASMVPSATGVTLQVQCAERWTTIPILKFSSGGGANQAIVGIFDANIAGQYLESGIQYERLGEANSGVAWLKNPRFLGHKIGVELQLWSTNRLRTKYVQGPIDPEVKMGFLHSRRQIFAAVTTDVADLWQLGITVDSNNDRFSDRYVDEDVRLKTLATGLPPATDVLFTGLRARYGRVNHLGWLASGLDATVSSKYGASRTSGIDDFSTHDLALRWYEVLFVDHQLAIRAGVGTTDTKVLQYWHYFGGLADVRGFVDNRFAGRDYWQANFEYRWPLMQSPSFVVQHVLFHDVVATAEEFSALDHASGASLGTGLRLIAPKIYRLVVRLDYAKPIVKSDEMPISFGVQQFF